jgi:hypothetical protein
MDARQIDHDGLLDIGIDGGGNFLGQSNFAQVNDKSSHEFLPAWSNVSQQKPALRGQNTTSERFLFQIPAWVAGIGQS